MAATLFQSVQEFRNILAYDQSDDVDRAILNALEKAALSLEGDLRTKFVAGTVVDTFLARKLKFGTGTQTLSKLLLRRGFVDEGQTITVIAATTNKGLDDSSQMINLRDNDGVDHLLIDDAEKGRIMVADYTFLGIDINYIRVGYTCGFSNDGGDPPQYSGTPDWLIQMAALQAELSTFHNPVLNPGITSKPKQTQGQDPRAGIIKSTLQTMIQDHVCYGPGWAKPAQSVFTAA